MQLLTRLDPTAGYRGGVVAIGNFDGVHRGHRRIAETLTARARLARRPSVVLTFEPPPAELLRPGQAPPRLSTTEWKAELLAGCGIDFVIAYPTDHALLGLSPHEFFDAIVRGELNAQGLVEGPNFFFGRDRAGSVETLCDLCDAAGLPLEIVPATRHGDWMVSSSHVRRRIEAGELADAVELLGHPYRVTGRVVAGAARGRTLGFPTANLEGIATLLPPDGVYAGRSAGLDRAYPAAVNIGPNPTFGEGQRKLEAHLVGFSGDLYGRHLSIDLLTRIRPTQRFAGPDELRAQIRRDIDAVAQAAAE